MSEAKSYHEEWKKTKDLSKGGQATTFLAEDLKTKGKVEVIKQLNQQKNQQRRTRMFREMTNLSTLQHPNIAKCLDSNAQYYKDESYILFMVLEFISGSTLDEIKPLSFEISDKIACIRTILETVAYCHGEGIIHRDIKPDNIVLREGNIRNPVLLDFGLSFNSNETEPLTPEEEHIGNRFLILPEQKKGEENKRDERSDISAVVGLLFYLFTGIRPTILIDEKNNKPHQTEEAKAILNSYEVHKNEVINSIFDKGFDSHIDQRWQTAESLIKQLDILESKKPMQSSDESSLLQSIREKISSQKYENAKSIEEAFDEVQKHIWIAVKEVSKTLGDDWSQIQGGENPARASKLEYRARIAPFNKNYSYAGETNFHAFITGSELVVKIVERGVEFEAFRQPLIGEKNWDNFIAELKKHYLAELNKKLK